MVPEERGAEGGHKLTQEPPPQPAVGLQGVDLDRNYPFPGDYQVYYSVAAELYVSASRNPCDFDNYIGEPLGEEPEVKNVIELDHIDDRRRLRRRALRRPQDPVRVGTNGSQSDPATKDDMNWRKTRWHRGGDRRAATCHCRALDRLFPNDPPHRLQDIHGLVGGQMRDAILRAAGGDQRAGARSRYEVQPAIDMYPAPGVASDFAFSRNLDPGTLRPLIAFTIECSLAKDLEGGRQPPGLHLPQDEREVHLALLTLLSRAAARAQP